MPITPIPPASAGFDAATDPGGMDASLTSLPGTWRRPTRTRLRRPGMSDLPTIGGLVGVAVGLLVVTAWVLRVDPLRRMGMDVAPISVDTGTALLLAGLGVLALSRPVGSSARRHGYLPLLMLLGLSVLGAVGTLLGMDIGLSLMPSTLGSADAAGQTAHAAPSVLVCCVLVSVALVLRTRGSMTRLPGMLLAVALAIAWLNVLDLLLGDDVAILFGSTLRLAPGPAIALVLLCVGALAMLGPAGPLTVFVGPSSTARVARRLLVVSLVVPVVVAWVRLQGEQFGLYAPGYGTSLVVMGIVVLLAVAIWHTARVAERTESARRAAIDELDRFFDVSVDMLATVDAAGQLLRVNPAWTVTLGYAEHEMLGHSVIEFIHPDDLESTIASMGRRFASRSTVHGFQNRYRHQDGTYRWLEWNTAPSADGRLAYTSARDVTARRHEAEFLLAQRERLRQRNQGLAVRVAHDPLTGLRNRAWFDRAYGAVITRRLRRTDSTALTSAIMFDLDHFGMLNKQYGHQAGDVMLRQFADLLRARVRGGDITARFGGEEFVAVLIDCSREDAAQAADDIRVALEAIEVDLDGLTIRTTVSAGCAALEPGMTPADLLARADLALSMAKRAGRNTVVVA